jgi:hypothetical protein
VSAKLCTACLAVDHPGFTLEAAFIAGMAIGVSFAGGRSVRETWEIATRNLCDRHYSAFRLAVHTYVGIAMLPPEPAS